MRITKINKPIFDGRLLPFAFLNLIPYLFFLYLSWWMSICTILSCIIQTIFIITYDRREMIEVDVEMIPNIITEYRRKHKTIWYYLIPLFVIDLFPVYAMNWCFVEMLGGKSTYEGGVITFLIVFFVIICTIIVEATPSATILIERVYEDYKKKGKTKEEIEQEQKAKKAEAERIEEEHLDKVYGESRKVVSYGRFDAKKIVVSDETEMIRIESYDYKFTDLLNFNVTDEKREVYTPAKYETKTDTGSMLGRAVVGGVLTGGVGAVVGGATASKKTTQVGGGTSTTTHDYRIHLYMNDINNSQIELQLYRDSKKVEELASIFTYILNKNQNKNSNAQPKLQPIAPASSLSDELLKLAELKKQGLLTEEEFNQQKTKLLNT